MTETTEIDEIDRDALERALVACRKESPERSQQIDAMLRCDPWEQVAEFAAHCAQMRALKLRPWQLPPSSVNDDPEDMASQPGAVFLQRRLLEADLSVYEPDPEAALAAAAK